jgi:hypothetical protein
LKLEMRDKNLLIIFICFVLMITFAWPKKAEAGTFDWLKRGIGNLFGWFSGEVVKGIAGIVYWITKGVHLLFWWVNNSLIAPVINMLAQLDPFKKTDGTSPISVLWNVLRNFAYIILVFSALAAGFEWLIGQDESAKRLIFHIIIVALIINFVFVLIEETFGIVKEIEKGITGDEGGKVGSIIAASLWQKDPLKEIMEATEDLGEADGSEISKALVQVIGYMFIIALDMLIFIILFVTALLFVARYIMIIFLAGVSPIAVASLTFPEFKGVAGLGEIFSGLRVFNTWLGYLINWLLVVPIFIILVILGNVLTNNVLTQTQVKTSSAVVEFVILLFVLGGWYIISLMIARKMSKGVSKLAEGAATAALLGVGGLAARGWLNLAGPKIGSILTKAGGYLTEKVPTSRFTAWMAGPAQAIKTAGQNLTQRAYESQAKLSEAKMNLYREKLERETDPNKIAGITKEISSLTQQFKSNPYVLQKVVSQIEKVPPKTFAKIATNKDAISPLLSPNLPEETAEKIANKIKSLSTQSQLDIFKDKDLRETYLRAGPRMQTAFFEALSNIDSDKIIKTIGEGDPGLINQIKENEELKGAINKATKRLWGAIERGATKEIADSILNIGEGALKNYGQIQSMASQINPKADLNAALQEAIKIDPLPILKAAAKSADLNFINSLKQIYPDRQSAISALNAKEGTDLYRLINQIWSPIVVNG